MTEREHRCGLHFFTVRIKQSQGKKQAQAYLGWSDSAEEDFASSSLTSFCFPLGPESVVPKEFLASEVGIGHFCSDL
jgi:hypothetical protein